MKKKKLQMPYLDTLQNVLNNREKQYVTISLI